MPVTLSVATAFPKRTLTLSTVPVTWLRSPGTLSTLTRLVTGVAACQFRRKTSMSPLVSLLVRRRLLEAEANAT